ncbi:MAG: histidine phosphatase family protein [Halobacteriales archaeon]|nr:histidine phosphatase family protein [Halobacteriales archaeon]
MGAPAHRIVLLRHAEAEGAAASDRARVLTAKGEGQARRIGLALHGQGLAPGAVVCSPAARALQTARLAAAAAQSRVAIEQDETLHEAGPEEVLACLGRHPQAIVWVVGHNPSLQATARLLGGLPGAWHLDKGCAAVLDTDRWPPDPDATRLHRLLAPGHGN